MCTVRGVLDCLERVLVKGFVIGRHWLTLVLLVGVSAVTIAGLATASSGGQGSEQASDSGSGLPPRFDGLCEGGVCTVVQGRTDPSDPSATAGERLAAHGTPAGECPEATAAYAAAGREVDAFMGPCPTAEQVRDRVGLIDPARDVARQEGALKALEALQQER